jgi:hypothetical protein
MSRNLLINMYLLGYAIEAVDAGNPNPLKIPQSGLAGVGAWFEGYR